MLIDTMKKIGFVLIAVFLCIFLSRTVSGAEEPILKITLTSQNPYPVEPGKVVDIEVALQNSGYKDAENIVLEIEPKAPFTLLPGQEKIKTFTKISSISSVKTSYKLYVDKFAISDNYELNFKYYKSGLSNVSISEKVQIFVQGEPKIVLQGVKTEPEEIKPGNTVNVIASIKNVGTGTAHYMEFYFTPNSTYITPVLSGGSFYIEELKPNEEKDVSFKLYIDNSAEYKTYMSVLYASYKDDAGNVGANSFTIGLPIRGEPIIDILSTKLEDSEFTVNIQNIGTATAKAIKVVLTQNNQIKDVSIISELKPTKYKTLRFTGFSYGSAMINITYLDETNKEHKESVPVSITKKSEERKSGFSLTSVVLILIIIAEGYYIIRLRKRKRHGQ